MQSRRMGLIAFYQRHKAVLLGIGMSLGVLALGAICLDLVRGIFVPVYGYEYEVVEYMYSDLEWIAQEVLGDSLWQIMYVIEQMPRRLLINLVSIAKGLIPGVGCANEVKLFCILLALHKSKVA